MLDTINEFFLIEQNENFGHEVFSVLSKIIKFNSGYIYFTNPKRLEYSFGDSDGSAVLKEDLKLKNTVFGEIVITGEKFTDDDKKKFKACSSIIANITKDVQISKIIKMQIEALQEGYKKTKEAEEIKTKFLSHVSHELRTPLNSILGFSDMLTLAGKLNEKQKEYVNDIKVSGLNLLEMINEILDISKIEAGAIKLNLREFEVSQAVEEASNTIKPLLLSKNIKLVKNIENFVLKADYQKIQQILFNLLSNAIKFTPQNGKIVITTMKKDGKLILSVKDNGIGIAKKNQSKIFKKFEQVGETQEPSTGLGLAIVKELVKLHKGKIYVKSAISKGAEFIVEMN